MVPDLPRSSWPDAFRLDGFLLKPARRERAPARFCAPPPGDLAMVGRPDGRIVYLNPALSKRLDWARTRSV